MYFPKIYLAIDNCFASKRWTDPEQWMELCGEWGIQYIEASADNECDPLYSTSDSILDWSERIRDYSRKNDIYISSLYSGHGTYATLGLAHNDARVRTHILQNWLYPMVDTAVSLNAGLGFFCHAFSEPMMANEKMYRFSLNNLYQEISEITRYANAKRIKFISTEQMYSPHQFPWTLNTAQDFIQTIYGNTGLPMYITVDTGHSSAQKSFVKPSRSDVEAYITQIAKSVPARSIWLGSNEVYAQARKIACTDVDDAARTSCIMDTMDRYDYLFAQEHDGDPYMWLKNFGCYSPIVHLQQTDGTFSKHLPFTEQNNAAGIIRGDEVLRAIYSSYLTEQSNMPPKCEELFLTLEIFSGTAERNIDIKRKMKESVEYWRQFIPKDGMSLDAIAAKL